jgi:uncharacterized protein YndB with AHSA1/START domain
MTAITSDTLLPYAPGKVWAALTDPDKLSRWLMPTDFRAEVGARFTFDTGNWGKTQCEVLELVPEQLLRISWVNPPLDTTVTWRLVPEGTGTRLFLEHAGFDLDNPQHRFAFEGMKNGWGGDRGAARDRARRVRGWAARRSVADGVLAARVAALEARHLQAGAGLHDRL